MAILPEVEAALASRQPVVCLESTVITHGLPRPVNLELARQMEAVVRLGGATPATAAVLDGQVCLGLEDGQLERLAQSADVHKVNRRDLGVAVAAGHSGGTTVSATMFIAHAAGVRLFATGGIGGVHRGSGGDVSADLPELARTPVGVVCSGAKSILDLPRTVEWLETAGVPVLGFGTDEFPGFYSRHSGLPVSGRVDTPAQAAAALRAHWDLGLETGALVCVPCPEPEALPPAEVDAAVEEALRNAQAAGIHGKALTPYLLSRLADLSHGATLQANLALLTHNARVAAEIAVTLAETASSPD